MKSFPQYGALAATITLHTALILAALVGMSGWHSPIAPPASIEVALLPPASPAPPTLPAALPSSAKIASKRAPQSKRKSALKPGLPARKKKHPPPHSHAEPAAPAATPEQPMPSAAVPASGPPSAPAATPPPTPPAAKTSVSISASYAASNRKPPYPRLSIINDEQGTVVLRVLVRADGSAGAIEIQSSSGYPLLDTSAKSTVQTWRFNPATVDGKPVSEWYKLAVPFTLQNN